MNTSHAVSYDENELPPGEAELRQWITAWYQSAVRIGYIEPEYELDNATAARLEGYFEFGLTPVEGAGVIFGLLH
ncbi:hypothetical protein WKR88_29150 [Trinickia caryophylli]|nr:hypothetical protein [Trinickia caryophylli]PMS11477.1 hypothetical protein C0Z17_14935 [Trinickia caryophylli]TRX20200.1 hypothetical protein FNF07_04860 [Trinickia caryophylli]WQE13788.1 hypothetical protein U0034_18040 [Trinickia caryophylli]